MDEKYIAELEDALKPFAFLYKKIEAQNTWQPKDDSPVISMPLGKEWVIVELVAFRLAFEVLESGTKTARSNQGG